MNADLPKLQPYPFERLRQLLAGATPPAQLPHINLSIGEPKHPTPPLIHEALTQSLAGLAQYPTTLGSEALRQAIAAWLGRRYGGAVDPATQVLPSTARARRCSRSRKRSVDRSREAVVISPNPFYQIYEGAALLAGARPLFLPTTPANGFRMMFDDVPAAAWRRPSSAATRRRDSKPPTAVPACTWTHCASRSTAFAGWRSRLLPRRCCGWARACCD